MNDSRSAAGSNHRNQRKSGDFKRFSACELRKRDKLNLDIVWLKDESLGALDSLLPPDAIAAEIVENLQAILEAFQVVADGLGEARTEGDDEQAIE